MMSMMQSLQDSVLLLIINFPHPRPLHSFLFLILNSTSINNNFKNMHDDELQDDLGENMDALLDDRIFEEVDMDLVSEDSPEDEDIEDKEDLEDEDQEIFDELDILAQEEEEEDMDFFNDEDDY